jgi:dinuclear metal center YbgI/SA1388 family protein
MTATVGDIVTAVGQDFPWQWAESWDNVGLVVGDPSAPANGVLVSLDADVRTIRRAAALGVGVLVTHHPPFMDVAHRVTPATSPALHAASEARVAVISAHTNLDRAPQAAGVLLQRLGLGEGEPLESAPAQEAVITVYAPEAAAGPVRAALAAAGAGRIGLYTACSFSAPGEGRFIPGDGADPHQGSSGAPTTASEVRIEAVVARDALAAVMAHVKEAHPYEEPLITGTDALVARGAVALGRFADLDTTTTLAGLAESVANAFDCTPRVWGEPDSSVTRIATGTGSAASVIPDVSRVGANALLAGEVRYHDALDAVSRGLSVVEAGHDVTEWPLVPILAASVARTPGLEENLVTVDEAARGWWTP